jgi:hypothetical protein
MQWLAVVKHASRRLPTRTDVQQLEHVSFSRAQIAGLLTVKWLLISYKFADRPSSERLS